MGPASDKSTVAAAATAIATGDTANASSTEALTGGKGNSPSHRAGQRLSEAKELDREFSVTRDNCDDGGGAG